MHDPAQPVAPLRRDIDLIPFGKNSEEHILMRDPSGYSERVLMLHPASLLIIEQFDGSSSARQIAERFRTAGIDLPIEKILEFVSQLEQAYFLESPFFIAHRDTLDAEYIRNPIRECAFAGYSYPDDPEELRAFMGKLFKKDDTVVQPGTLAGVIAPHIDLQVGPEVYVPAFKYLEEAEFDTVIILGVSHYSSEDLFIMTYKDLDTPLGLLHSDKEFIDLLHHHSGRSFTTSDVAYRQEHSIEFPAVFLREVFGESKRVVPILVSSFEEFLRNGTRPSSSERYRMFVEAFRKTVLESGRRIVFLLSVDWSHIGHKFGDERAASELLPIIRHTDSEQIRALERADYDALYDLLFATQNSSRIDGFACISTFFDLAAPKRGALLKYEQWHEVERKSGVTFASMAFFTE